MAGAIDPVEVKTTAANDWVWAIVGSLLSVFLIYGLITSDASDWQNADGVKREALYLLLVQLVGVTAIRVFAAGLAFFCGLNAVGAAWRLLDNRLALRADERGLVFHPSFHGAHLNWSDVKSVELVDGRPARIAIRLKKRFWSVTHPFMGRAVQLNIIAIGSTYEGADTKVETMRRWLKT